MKKNPGTEVATEVLTIHESNPDIAVLKKAAVTLQNGNLVAFPTETVYGLGADAFNPEAVQKIYKAKGRPGDNPLIVHIIDMRQLFEIAEPPSDSTLQKIEAFWPGPLTVILKKKPHVSPAVTCGRDTVAIRMPSHKTARLLIRESGLLIAAPSANASGRPSPTKAMHVLQDLNGKVDLILDGGDVAYGLESTVVDLSGPKPVLLRPGTITQEMLAKEFGTVGVDPSVFGKTSHEGVPKAPGMKYTHYAPLASVTIVTGELEQMVRAIDHYARISVKKTGILATEQTKCKYTADAFILSAGDRDKPQSIASALFDNLRRFDSHGIEEVYAESIPTDGIGLAIMNRLQKAAGFNIVQV